MTDPSQWTDPRRRGVSMMEEFACPNCRHQSVVYPDANEDRGRVVCRTCGAFLGTLAQFRHFVVQRTTDGIILSGC
jgi:transcription elongation factor Elf1